MIVDPRVFQREPKDAPRVPIEAPTERKKQVYQNVLFDTPALEDPKGPKEAPKVPKVDPRVPQEDQKGPGEVPERPRESPRDLANGRSQDPPCRDLSSGVSIESSKLIFEVNPRRI